jgi:hypothetical protein
VVSQFGVGWSLQSELASKEEATVSEDSTNLNEIIPIDDERVRDYLHKRCATGDLGACRMVCRSEPS